VRALEPHTEADPNALLLTLLTAFGNIVGSRAKAQADGAPHPAKLFAVVVGETANARKGTSWQQIRRLLDAADPEWHKGHVTGGLSSGEGLVKALLNAPEHRLLVVESEFARTLKVMDRLHNTLSEITRQAWDSSELSVMTKDAVQVAESHVSFIAHITEHELTRLLTSTIAANGYANRFLFGCVRRSKLLPFGNPVDQAVVARLGARIRDATEAASTHDSITRTPAADELWREFYFELASQPLAGLSEGLLSRAPAQLLRLSVVYALLDGNSKIEVEHLVAAWSVWQFCQQSVLYLFGNQLGDPIADEIYASLRCAPSGELTKRDVLNLFHRHVLSHEIDRAIGLLEQQGLVRVEQRRTGSGRHPTVISLVHR
jgi:hypothetical protein